MWPIFSAIYTTDHIIAKCITSAIVTMHERVFFNLVILDVPQNVHLHRPTLVYIQKYRLARKRLNIRRRLGLFIRETSAERALKQAKFGLIYRAIIAHSAEYRPLWATSRVIIPTSAYGPFQFRPRIAKHSFIFGENAKIKLLVITANRPWRPK